MIIDLRQQRVDVWDNGLESIVQEESEVCIGPLRHLKLWEVLNTIVFWVVWDFCATRKLTWYLRLTGLVVVNSHIWSNILSAHSNTSTPTLIEPEIFNHRYLSSHACPHLKFGNAVFRYGISPPICITTPAIIALYIQLVRPGMKLPYDGVTSDQIITSYSGTGDGRTIQNDCVVVILNSVESWDIFCRIFCQEMKSDAFIQARTCKMHGQ